MKFPQNAHLGIEPVRFSKVEVEVPRMFFEYNVQGSRLQFHVWPTEDTFPEWSERAIHDGLSYLPEDRKVVDYVPEVGSWYVEIRYGLGGPGLKMVESIVTRIGEAAEKYV